MKRSLLVIPLSFVLMAALCAGVFAEEEQWKLINEDELGNRLYIDEASIKEDSERGTVTVTMRFDLKKSETKMLFVDEIDCARSLIKRVSLKMLKPVCTGDDETYSNTFEGKWDVISEGIERRLFEEVCK